VIAIDAADAKPACPYYRRAARSDHRRRLSASFAMLGDIAMPSRAPSSGLPASAYHREDTHCREKAYARAAFTSARAVSAVKPRRCYRHGACR
jgi:hypothetical protein